MLSSHVFKWFCVIFSFFISSWTTLVFSKSSINYSSPSLFKNFSKSTSVLQFAEDQSSESSPELDKKLARDFIQSSELPLDEHNLGDQIDYVLGGGDVLKILVYDEPDLSMEEIRVSIGGYINFPLIGKVEVNGLSTSELESRIENLLEKGYIISPQVTILIQEYASRKVFILGAVNRPGSFELKSQATILEMISRAGGISERAAQRFMILRSVNGKSQRITIDRKKLIQEGDLSLNKIVRNNDTIFVPLADVIYIFGEVEKPGPYQMTNLNRTVLSAITLAGGFTKLGAPKKTRIVRVTDGTTETINVNVDDIIKRGNKEKDIELLPEDVIIVPETLF